MDDSDYQKIINKLNQVFDNVEALKATIKEKDAEIAELRRLVGEVTNERVELQKKLDKWEPIINNHKLKYPLSWPEEDRI